MSDHPLIAMKISTGDFLRALWPQGVTGYLTLFTRTIDRTRTPVDWASSIDELLEHARHRREAGDVWYGVASRERNLGGARRGGADECLHLPALYADIDVKGPGHAITNLPGTLEEAWHLLDLSPITPSAVIATGGGLQPYWFLAEPLHRDDAEPLLQRWGDMWLEHADRAGWHLDNVFNIDRVLRLPNTQNFKTGEPREVPIVSWHPELRYGLDDLEPYVAPVRVTVTAERVPWTGPPRPGDHLNLTMRTIDILRRNGWQHNRTNRNGNEQWTRPGKDTREGSSATYYAVDGHVTVWSNSIPGLDTRRPYDTFGLFTLLEHGGDFQAATRALGDIGFGTPRATPERVEAWLDEFAEKPAVETPFEGMTGRIEFDHRFWTRNREGEQWLISPILALGRSHALYAPAKAGKSLLALEIVAAVASGRSVLDQPAGAPRVVLYADFEMTEDDIYERLVDLGYSEADDLSHLHYHLHPMIPALDTVQGGAALVAHAERIGAELVVVDTVARTISGEENSSDTIISLARYTFTPLKARGITSLRVDHAGKDLTKGQRGTSAKNDDVDIVWQLTVGDAGTVTLRATHRRLSWVPELVDLVRHADPLRHHQTDHAWPSGTAEAARRLDNLSVPHTATVVAAQEALKAAGWGTRRSIVGAAMRYRTGTALGTVLKGGSVQYPEPVPVTPSEVREPLREPSGTAAPDVGTLGAVTKEPPQFHPTEPYQPDLSAWDTEEF